VEVKAITVEEAAAEPVAMEPMDQDLDLRQVKAEMVSF
jgi:hypothetical protein